MGETAFCSYKRDDTGELVSRIHELFFMTGDIFLRVDKTHIHPAENWRERLEREIADSNAFIFFISPGSIASFLPENKGNAVCAWEVGCALRYKKHIVSVLWKSSEHIDLLPDQIKRQNFVSFQEARHAGLEDTNTLLGCCERLKTGLGAQRSLWMDEGLRWIGRLEDWSATEHPDLLLDEDEMKEYVEWQQQRPSDRLLLDIEVWRRCLLLSQRKIKADNA
jgi:hypothetical protein